jgi:hypothetical protein
MQGDFGGGAGSSEKGGFLSGVYNFYINDPNWGRMFVRISPYLPFSARICLNQHHWLANRTRSEGIDFKQCSTLKQYVRDHLCLRTEPATNDVTAYGVKKAVENLPQAP